jgi:endonuclease/exonuclease/phosphatase (EEP) superfamily protein YafD
VWLSVDVAGQRVTVLVTHLDRTTDRAAQLQVVMDDFLGQPGPAVLMGDLNTRSDDPLLTRLRAAPGVIDCLTQRAAAMPETIDWIFVRGLECRDAGLRDEGASDHPLAWAELSVSVK